MTPSHVRAALGAALGVALGTVLALTAVPRALAVEERGWLTLEGGSDFYDPQQALRDSPGFGLRAAGHLNRWIGVEGLLHRASADQDPPTLGSATYTHYAAGLVLTPDRYTWVLPYLYGGYGSVKLDRDGFGAKSSGAFHGGVGAVFRVGERIGFRLDARDVNFKQEGGPGLDTRVNAVQISTGVTAFWFGRPRDTDEDGVPNKHDRCPETPTGAVVDASGCPLDTDQDKVYDGLDKCAGTPVGAIVDANGCPLDGDGDGVFDGLDKCADTAKGVVVDALGCPIDSDGDAVFDGPDKCAETPRGSKVDANGCPLDADGDGVPDGIDSCPFTPLGALVNAGGCPLAPTYYEQQMLDDWVMRLTDLEFAPDSIRLLPQAMARIDSVGTVLQQWPMLKFDVGTHIDNQLDEARRQPLSHLRARAVLQYIYSKFPSLNSKNYWYTGYGDTRPLASNLTEAGRAQNRRVEFRLMSMDILTQQRQRRESLGSTPVPPAPGLTRKTPEAPTVPEAPTPEAPAPPDAPAPPQEAPAPQEPQK